MQWSYPYLCLWPAQYYAQLLGWVSGTAAEQHFSTQEEDTQYPESEGTVKVGVHVVQLHGIQQCTAQELVHHPKVVK